MLKLLKILIVVLLISDLMFILKPVRTYAQDEKTPYQIAYQAYLDQMNAYQAAHQEYILRKSQYDSFKTLQAQQDAQAATVKMMQERDQAVLMYIKALRERVSENVGIDDATKNSIYAGLDTETTWFSDHKANIPTAGSLQDLTRDSRDAQIEYTNAQPIFYRAIGSSSDGKFTDLYKRFNDRFSELKTKVDEIKGETREEYSFSSDKLQRLDRWIFDADSSVERAKQKQTDAETIILAIGSNSRGVKNMASAYSTILTNLTQGQQYLKEAGGYLQEIVRDIKTDD